LLGGGDAVAVEAVAAADAGAVAVVAAAAAVAGDAPLHILTAERSFPIARRRFGPVSLARAKGVDRAE
jgi:hypothetical protein